MNDNDKKNPHTYLSFEILTMESEATLQFKWVKEYLNTLACLS